MNLTHSFLNFTTILIFLSSGFHVNLLTLYLGIFTSVCACMCVCKYEGVCSSTCVLGFMCVCGGLEENIQCDLCEYCLHPLGDGLSLAWSSSIWLDWLPSEAQRSYYLQLPRVCYIPSVLTCVAGIKFRSWSLYLQGKIFIH